MTDFRLKHGAALVSILVVLAACTTPPPESPVTLAATPSAQPPSAPQAAGSPQAAPSSSSSSTITPGSLRDFQENVGAAVYFSYDTAEISQSSMDTLRRQAAWLQRYPAVTLVIEGHADERGTREYNLALGARRAAAVMSYLVVTGISTARLETVSFGKERPVCTQSAEACWQQNRRGVSTIRTGAVAAGS